jgi:hypothetical protein
MDKKLGKYSLDIINGMIDWVRVIDPDHRIVFMNKAMKDQVGDFTGMKCYQALGLNSPCPDCITDETLRTGRIHKKEVARKLLFQTIYGAAKMLRDTNEDPSLLRQRVTSPGGTTFAALEVLKNMGLEDAVNKAVLKAAVRSRELGVQSIRQG